MGNKEKLLWAAAFGVVSFVRCNDGLEPSVRPTSLPELPIPTQVDDDPLPTKTATTTSEAPTLLPPELQMPPTKVTPTEPTLHTHSEVETRNSLKYRSVNWDSLNLIDPVNVQRWEHYILDNANKYDITPEVIAAIIDTESHGRTDGEWAELEGDGVGLMGVMPQELGFPNRPTREKLLNPETNVEWGTSIFWEIYNNPQMGNGNVYDALLWYNAGLEENLEYAIPYADAIYDKLGWPHPDEIPDRLEEIVYE